MSPDAPLLRTDRLTLAGHATSDLADLTAMWADPAVYAHIGGKALSREQTWQRLLSHIGHWALLGYGYWLARETASGRLVGSVGLMEGRRATQPSFEGTPEAGWALASWAHGHGFAREAMDAVLDWADARGITRTVCIIVPGNTASITLAGRLGYRLVEEARYNDEPTLLFARDPLATPAAIA